jgi:hypothetical protein
MWILPGSMKSKQPSLIDILPGIHAGENVNADVLTKFLLLSFKEKENDR